MGVTDTDRLRAALDTLCWSDRVVEDKTGIRARAIQYMRNGGRPVPAALLEYLEPLAEAVRTAPPPAKPDEQR